MIGTIGFLVQDTSHQRRWLLSASLYTVACVSTAMLFGAALGALGHVLRRALWGATVPPIGAWLVGLLAVAYAMSDAGLFALPRPTVTRAVPVTWWRWWKPYGAALAYGAALGLGVTTRIAFGAFYVLCAWSVFQGSPIYGALLMGTYGAGRALVMFPASWGVYRHRAAVQEWLAGPLFDLPRAQRVVAAGLMLFGVLLLVSAAMERPPAHAVSSGADHASGVPTMAIVIPAVE